MFDFVLVRHCESVGNIAFQKSFFEQDDSMYTDEFMNTPSIGWPLPECGRSQAEIVGMWLRDVFICNKVFVSDARRVIESATCMGYPKESLVFNSLLRERDYAGLELKPKKEWMCCVSDLNEVMRSMTWRPPGGESMLDLTQRTDAFLRTFILPRRLRPLVVTHGDVIQAMRKSLLGLDDSSYHSFRELRGNYVRPGQLFLYRKRENNFYHEKSFYFDGSEWCDLSVSFVP